MEGNCAISRWFCIEAHVNLCTYTYWSDQKHRYIECIPSAKLKRGTTDDSAIRGSCFLTIVDLSMSKDLSCTIALARTLPSIWGNYLIKVVIARYRLSSDIVKTLTVHYFMFLEYMRKVSKLLTIQNPRKLPLQNKVKKRLNMGFPMLRENWTKFSITVNKYLSPIQSNFFVRLKTMSHFILQN